MLIKVEATSVNRADILQRKGLYPPPKGSTNIIGLECAGYQLQNAEDYVNGTYKKGRRVMALLSGGGYSDVVAVHKDHVIDIPDTFSFEQAAAVPETWLTSYQLINLVAQAEKGDIALIHAAASGIGCAAIQICRMQGVRSIAVASSGEKLKFAESLGSYASINYKETPDFSKMVKDMTDGKGVNVILDCIGAQNFEYNISAAAMDCKWVFFGALGGVKLEKLNLGKLLGKRINLLSSTLKNRSTAYKTNLIKNFTADCLPGFKSQQLSPIIDSVLNLSQVAEAHKRAESNLNIGKIVLKNDLAEIQ